MPSIAEMILSLITKRGVMYEAKNFIADVPIPNSNNVAHITIEHMAISIHPNTKES